MEVGVVWNDGKNSSHRSEFGCLFHERLTETGEEKARPFQCLSDGEENKRAADASWATHTGGYRFLQLEFLQTVMPAMTPASSSKSAASALAPTPEVARTSEKAQKTWLNKCRTLKIDQTTGMVWKTTPGLNTAASIVVSAGEARIGYEVVGTCTELSLWAVGGDWGKNRKKPDYHVDAQSDKVVENCLQLSVRRYKEDYSCRLGKTRKSAGLMERYRERRLFRCHCEYTIPAFFRSLE
ncbi:hypothetical protein GALMADRAFT_216688 [Galerina marginata CBS 339.88]|uniref:Uncharacterized protein n=1 Tax=Galerina marginata (strain CBS 339.88) TaxID=685588 RepID=A0A067S807_GALM3|nr:hypothetical protein GALMADRAFT_216688 [Galerina marginata CBS 339.88]